MAFAFLTYKVKPCNRKGYKIPGSAYFLISRNDIKAMGASLKIVPGRNDLTGLC